MWWLSELGWAGLEDGLGWPPCRFVSVFCLGRGLRGLRGWAVMPLPSHLAPVVLSELGWAGLKDGQDAASPFCRCGCLNRGLRRLPQISLMGAPWATLWGWGGGGG